jgi:hypothetical protein
VGQKECTDIAGEFLCSEDNFTLFKLNCVADSLI